MRRLYWLAVMLAATAVAAPAGVSAPPASPPATLTGETLLACSADRVAFCGTDPGQAVGSLVTTLDCRSLTEPGSFTFAASGIATGPYPGTFTETGTVTVGEPQTALTFTASFTILSPAGRVDGTKTSTAIGIGDCHAEFEEHVAFAFVDTAYDATVTTATGTYHDEGAAHTTIADASDAGPSPVPQSFTFGESFTSALPATIPILPPLPTTKDQCKNGGWKAFGIFKNQGECVSFVANGGKKGP